MSHGFMHILNILDMRIYEFDAYVKIDAMNAFQYITTARNLFLDFLCKPTLF